MSEELERLKQERDRLEADKRMLEKQKQKLAYIPKTETTAKVSLRNESKTLYDDHVKEMLKKYDFFERNMNAWGSFRGDFVDNGDGTITDRATGLMWDKSGSPSTRTMKRAKFYVKKLNRNRFAGYSDWRMPTIEELSSLLRKEKANGIHIDPSFNGKQVRCWSSDQGMEFLSSTSAPPQFWHVNFREGMIGLTIVTTNPATLSFYSISNHYVRAVRSLR
jgi:hypothetical protein